MKDTNGNKISTNDRERIWKVVYYFYREKLERNTEEKVVVKNNEVNDSFQATKLATDEEKRTYISRKKYDKNPFFLPSLLLILLMPFGLIYLGVHSNDVGKLEQSSPLASNVYFVTMCILIMLFFACDYFIIKKIVNKSLIKKIMKNNLYITECKIWDKKYCYRNTSDGDYVTEYFVKITVLSWIEQPIEDIEGRVISANINIDGQSIIRRTATLSVAVDDLINNITNVENLLSINKKVNL